MELTKTATYVLGVPITWNGVLNWLFLIMSTVTFVAAIIIQIVQAIKKWKKIDK